MWLRHASVAAATLRTDTTALVARARAYAAVIGEGIQRWVQVLGSSYLARRSPEALSQHAALLAASVIGLLLCGVCLVAVGDALASRTGPHRQFDYEDLTEEAADGTDACVWIDENERDDVCWVEAPPARAPCSHSSLHIPAGSAHGRPAESSARAQSNCLRLSQGQQGARASHTTSAASSCGSTSGRDPDVTPARLNLSARWPPVHIASTQTQAPHEATFHFACSPGLGDQSRPCGPPMRWAPRRRPHQLASADGEADLVVRRDQEERKEPLMEPLRSREARQALDEMLSFTL